MSRTFLFFFLLLPCTVIAQFTISGKVLNHDDASPVANVSVFLNNATIGDKTTVDGIFTLRNVTPGKYDLIVSIVGFSTYSQPITVSNANIILPVINLHPKVIALHEVKIKFKEDPERQRNIDLFKNEFLGTSELAKECKIMNPELLDLNFDQQAQTLTAKSSDFLIIENNALGYRVKYLLSDFMLNSYDPNAKQFLYEGVVLFEELKGTPVQKAQWEKRRQEIYANSTVHFLRAALNNKLGEEGFIVLRYLKNPERPADSLINSMIKTFSALKSERQYRDSLSFWIKKSKLPKLLPKQQPVALTGEDIIEKKNKAGLYAFGCSNDVLYVVYNNLHQFNATSLNHLSDENNTSSTLVFFNVPFAYFDNNGAIFNTGSLAYTGAWANKRLAELLPLNYEPAQTEPPVDNTLLKKIDSNLKAFNVGHRIEKAYLHFDKPYYAAGDTIYFKAYVTNPAYDPSTLSSILNVELIGPADEICGAIKLKLTDGMAPGDFALADTLKSGNYRLRAYTGTMRNQSEDYFFDQNVFVVNVPPTVSSAHKSISVTRSKNQTVKSQQLNTVLNKIDVQFFPEGGNFVNGVVSKVAFKAIAPNGFGANVKGTITDEQGHFVTDFISQHLGMGLITITPQPGKAYRANLAYKDSTKAKFDLPKASDAGYALHIDNADPRNVRVNIIAGLQSHRAKIYLIAQSGGIIYVYMPVKLINNTFNALIPKSELPDGIVQFALFSANGEPMNERLVFSRNYDPLNLKLATENSISRPHQKVKISLAATDKDYTAVSGNFSVAVTDETRLPVDEDNESTILSYLLLASDIKGYVEKPNYYFTGKSDKAAADLDVLMLTQGYHRFEWKKMMNNEYQPVAFDPEKLTEVSGKITNAAGKPIPHCKISLLSVSNVFFALDTISDASGKFVFKHLLARDSMRYIIQAADKQARKNTLIEIDKVKLPTISENAMETDLKQDSSMITYLNFSRNFHQEQQRQGIGKNTVMLKEIVIKEKRQQKYLKGSTNLNGAGNANDVITADQLSQGCPILLDCIKGRLHGIEFVNGTPYYGNLLGHMETAVMIDGVEVTGRQSLPNNKESGGPSKADIINMLSVSDIASIEIITDASFAAIYGVRGGGGAILINTKRFGDDFSGGSPIKQNFAYYSPVGYYKARVFYAPRYDLPKTNTTFADLRSTIYWNPAIITDKNGNATFEFFNADTKGNYRIVVEGIDDKGRLGRQVYRYKVE